MAPQQLSIRATTLQHSTFVTTDLGILLTFLISCSFLLIVQLHGLLEPLFCDRMNGRESRMTSSAQTNAIATVEAQTNAVATVEAQINAVATVEAQTNAQTFKCV
jgi:hypothetical protein